MLGLLAGLKSDGDELPPKEGKQLSYPRNKRLAGPPGHLGASCLSIPVWLDCNSYCPTELFAIPELVKGSRHASLLHKIKRTTDFSVRKSDGHLFP